jgi:ubiquinone/menaquinone biosynthesis C-methylase UbiE
MGVVKYIKKRKMFFDLRRKYSVGGREVFYLLAKEFLPENKNAVVLDIGSGDGSFVDLVNGGGEYKNIVLLDSNLESIKKLKGKGRNVMLYKIPERMPFDDESVDYVHCSHVVEHLCSNDFYGFLKELDRVLKKGAVMVISSPLLWDRFYDDISHMRPYNPSIYSKYLCTSGDNYSNQSISESYCVVNLSYRYRKISLGDELSSVYFLFDLFISVFKNLLSFVGFRRYIKNGYTIVLKKT